MPVLYVIRYGLRAVFGENFDALLDLVYKDHAEEINAYAARYLRNPENNVDDQRYLTEEFLADCADAEVKPSWWKEFIAKIRMWLRNSLPNLNFSNKDIEGVISMAHRRIRQDGATAKENLAVGAAGNNSVVKENLTTDGADGLRFAIIGEYGASRLQEAESLLDNLGVAKKMSADGKDANSIKAATGWELGGDGKWRMERPDIEFKADNFTAPVELNGHLQDLVDAPELFAAYPDLRGLMVLTTDNLPDNVAARHITDLSGDAIFFNRKLFAPTPTQQSMLERAENNIKRSYNWTEKDTRNAQMLRLEMNPQILRQEAYAAKDKVRSEQLAKFRRTFIHEIQHAIQFEEEFATGSSVQHFKEFPVKDKTLYKALDDAMQTEYEIRKQLAEYPDAYRVAERYFELDDVYFSDAQIDEQAILDEMDRLDDEIRAIGIGNLWDKYQIAVRERRAAQLKYDNSALSPLDAYRRTAGEVEARNATVRADMSMDERRQTLLADTADVAEEDIIYLEQLIGAQDMTPLRRDGAPNTAEQKGQLRDGNVPHADGFMEWAGLQAEKLYADYEFLFARHSQYFRDPEQARAAVELVLAQPEQVQNLKDNLSFVGFDEENGDIFRIEINPRVTGRTNHIRSVFKISAKQYETIKLATPRVLQPSKTATHDGAAATMTLASFLRYDNTNSEKVKSENDNFRFLLAEFSEAERRDITLILKPFVGFALDHEDRIYKEYLAKKGIAVSEKDAHAFAVTAMRENNSDRNKRTAQRREKARLEYNRKRDQYLYDNFPFYREAVEFAGSHDFKIKPSGKFRGEEFSGSFIAPEFVKYSGEKAAKNSGKPEAASCEVERSGAKLSGV